MATEAISVERLSKLYATRDGGVGALGRIGFSAGGVMTTESTGATNNFDSANVAAEVRLER